MNEQWKEIAGFPKYRVSNTGQIQNKNSGVTLNPFTTNSGYFQVHLWNDGKRFKRYIHRLVAEAFVRNTNGKPHVNHIDGNRQNNSSDNLEWCTRSENVNHSCYVLRQNVKAVRCVETGVVYPSIKEAARQTGIYHTSISMCCDGRYQQTHGFHFEYVEGGC
jgi:hypothetical protein